MTPIDKAQLLVFDKFAYAIMEGGSSLRTPSVIERAKACAILHCQGIIDELPDTICGYIPEGGTAMELDNYRKYFWKDVLNEINKI